MIGEDKMSAEPVRITLARDYTIWTFGDRVYVTDEPPSLLGLPPSFTKEFYLIEPLQNETVEQRKERAKKMIQVQAEKAAPKFELFLGEIVESINEANRLHIKEAKLIEDGGLKDN